MVSDTISYDPIVERFYTTGDIAKICRVAPRTAANWIDTGELKGIYLPPDKQQRRVFHDNLVDFMESNDIPEKWLTDYISEHP